MSGSHSPWWRPRVWVVRQRVLLFEPVPLASVSFVLLAALYGVVFALLDRSGDRASAGGSSGDIRTAMFFLGIAVLMPILGTRVIGKKVRRGPLRPFARRDLIAVETVSWDKLERRASGITLVFTGGRRIEQAPRAFFWSRRLEPSLDAVADDLAEAIERTGGPRPEVRNRAWIEARAKPPWVPVPIGMQAPGNPASAN